MPFVDFEIKYNKFDNSKRTQFMSAQAGAHTIRLLNDQAKTKPTHFFKNIKTTVLCLGDDCPVCANNRRLWMQFDKEAPKQPDYVKVAYRFFVNVYDKTPAKVCTACAKEYKDLNRLACDCGEVLPAPAPLNKVKVLSKGTTLRDDLGSVEKAILGADGTPLPLTSYDIILMVSGTDRDTKTTPVPRPDLNEPIPEGLELFDIEKAVIVLDAGELLDLQRGVSLKDIFSARKGKEEKESVLAEAPTVSQEENDKITNAVNELFGKK